MRARALAGIVAICLAALAPDAWDPGAWAPGAWAKVYSDVELSAFHIADARLDMDGTEAEKRLAGRGFTKDADSTPTLSTWREGNGAVVTLEISARSHRIAAVGLFQPIPANATMEMINSSVVPGLIKRFGEPTRSENTGQLIAMTYSGTSTGPGAITLTLRITKAGIDGRLGR